MIRVGITLGDINGIGPEIIIKALRDNRIIQDFIPIIYGSTKVFSHYKKALNDDEFIYQSCKSASEAIAKKVNIVNVWSEEVKLDVGLSTEMGGKYAFMALEKATEDLASNKIDVLVTAPICKEGILKAGFKFLGHTEYLAHLSNLEDALMIMVNGDLRVALTTTHVALKDVPKNLSKDLIVSKIKQLEISLKKDFGILRPRIAVFGLNPHAGENGKMGEEEHETIIPAIKEASEENILAFGPYPADSFFGSSNLSNFDAVLAMYHDQGLTAFKALSFDDGVNYTAGLPIVRTSPDHGTAFDIAGKNLASEQSFRSAIYLAIDIYKNRQFIKEINANPLAISGGVQTRKSSQKKEEIE
jgi:4-hydroxythreonine-4-phosphate dehydrogenase